MTDRFLSQVRFDLAMSDKSDKAYSRLLKIAKELPSLPKDNPLVMQLAGMLKGIPPGANCECCGFKGLVNVRRVMGHTVGPECSEHTFGSCKKR